MRDTVKQRIINEVGLSDTKAEMILDIIRSEGIVIKPKSKPKDFNKKDFRELLIQLGCNPQHVEDWIKVRDKKKAVYSETAIKRIIDECEKNDFPISEAVKICAENNWMGFKVKWVNNLRDEKRSNKKEVGQLSELAKEVLRHSGFEY